MYQQIAIVLYRYMWLYIFLDVHIESAYNAHKKRFLYMNVEWLTVEKISEEMGLPEETIRNWIRSRRLTAYRPGKQYLVKREDLNRFLEESKTGEDHKDQ